MIITILLSFSVSFSASAGSYSDTMEKALNLEKTGRIAEALDLYMSASMADPGKAEPLARASMMHLFLNSPDKALKTADLAVQKEPGHRGAWLNKSVIELARGEHDAALATAIKALERFPDDIDLMNNKATAEIGLKRYRSAQTTLSNALKLKPDDSTLNYNLACVFALSNIKYTAMLYLDKAIMLDPSLKARARTDPDLRTLRSLKPFKELTAK